MNPNADIVFFKFKLLIPFFILFTRELNSK